MSKFQGSTIYPIELECKLALTMSSLMLSGFKFLSYSMNPPAPPWPCASAPTCLPGDPSFSIPLRPGDLRSVGDPPNLRWYILLLSSSREKARIFEGERPFSATTNLFALLTEILSLELIKLDVSMASFLRAFEVKPHSLVFYTDEFKVLIFFSVVDWWIPGRPRLLLS